jgi:NADPH:quinone reductase-like Zn-dependent oxidoreductase
VLVRVVHAAVNPVDLQTRAGRTIAAADARFPMVLGWDAAGVVEEAGEDAPVAAGDRVALMTSQVVDQVGTYAERIVVAAATMALIPAALDAPVAAAVPLAGLTAAQGLDKLDLHEGDLLVINGAVGAVGRFALQLAVRTGVTVAAVVSAEDEQLARALGASVVLDRAAGPAAQLDREADAAFDIVGGEAAHALIATVRDGGRYVTAVPRRVDPSGPFDEQRGIRPRPVYVQPDPERLAQLLGLAADGLQVPIAHRLPVAEAGRAHALLAAGGLRGKVILDL